LSSSGEPTATELETDLPWGKARPRAIRRAPHLVLAWSLDEADRIGEAVPIAWETSIGRGGPLGDDPAPRTLPQRMRPSRTTACGPFASARLSRLQLVVEPLGEDEVRVRSLGRAPMRIAGRGTNQAVARVGDTIDIHNAAVFVVVSRPLELPAPAVELDDAFAFGTADRFGIVGESEAAWRLREALAFAASTDRHVLLLGESGVGKELAARSVHGLSARHARPFVARNAATLPESLLDAELFGNVKNYPNPGMAERPGLIGEADGSTLFLDEIGDLPEKSQVHLLRVLDGDGEYQRLGEARTLRSSFRLVAATNRPLEALKHDFLARFTHRIAIPGLPDRRDDIALIVDGLLRRMARENPAIAARFFEQRRGEPGAPRLAPDLMVRLLRHPFTHHVRELARLLWLAVGTADGDYIGVTPAVEAELRDSAESAETAGATELDRETLARALDAHGRSPTRTAKALGLKNRFVLLRLLKKHGLSASPELDGEP